MKISKNIFNMLVVPLASCTALACGNYSVPSNKWSEVQKLYAWWDQYVENNQLDFYDNLTVDNEHDWYKTIANDGTNDLVDFSVSTHAEAIMLWAYGPGYTVWNTSLHRDTNTSVLDAGGETKASMVAPDPKDPYDENDKPILVYGMVPNDGYKQLDSALNLTTVKNTLVGYHGFEDNECEIRSFIEQKLNINLEDDINLDNVNLSVLNNTSLIDYGYLALAMYESNSMNWVNNNVDSKLKVVPYLEVVIPPEIHAAYISYSKRTYYDGVFLSWPREFQLLCQRGLTIKINSADKTYSWNKGRQLLRLRCSVSYN